MVRRIFISIHALLAESDSPPSVTPTASRNFYPRSPCGERRLRPVRQAQGRYFYPRSPCGERLFAPRAFAPVCLISIHALLAESDLIETARVTETENFYPRSPCGERPCCPLAGAFTRPISIHALLAESDAVQIVIVVVHALFLSTLSLRRATAKIPVSIMLHSDFYPRSPCGERPFPP